MSEALILANDLGDRLDCREWVLNLVRDGGSHLSQDRKAFAFGEFPFEARIFFSEPAVFNRYRHLSGQYFQHRTNVLCQTRRRRVDQQNSGDVFLATKRIGNWVSVILKLWIAFDPRPIIPAC